MQTRIFLENIDFALRITVKRGAMHSAVYPLLTIVTLVKMAQIKTNWPSAVLIAE